MRRFQGGWCTHRRMVVEVSDRPGQSEASRPGTKVAECVRAYMLGCDLRITARTVQAPSRSPSTPPSHQEFAILERTVIFSLVGGRGSPGAKGEAHKPVRSRAGGRNVRGFKARRCLTEASLFFFRLKDIVEGRVFDEIEWPLTLFHIPCDERR